MSRVPWPRVLRGLCAAAVAAALLLLVAAYDRQGPPPGGPAGTQRQDHHSLGARADKELRDILNYSANDFVVVTGHSGRVYAFQVLGHVSVRRALKYGDQFGVSQPVPDSEKLRFVP